MDFAPLAQNRYSVRQYTTEPVAKSQMQMILRAAQLAPTACNKQCPRLIVVDEPEMLKKLNSCTPFRFDEPAAIVVCYDSEACWVRPYDGAKSGEVDASIVATHIMLQAADLGLGTCWLMCFEPDKVKALFEMPANIVPVAIITIGHAAPEAIPSSQHTWRKQIEEFVGFNKLP